MVLKLREILEDSNMGLSIATLGSGWNEAGYTKAIVSTNMHVELYSLKEDSEICEIAVVGVYPSGSDEFDIFAMQFAVVSGAAIMMADDSVAIGDAITFYLEIAHELSLSDLGYYHSEANGIEYMLHHFEADGRFVFSIRGFKK